MTDDERGLLNAVIESPDDDVVRLVYADWLEEHGRVLRANFIRDQIALAKLVANEEYDSEEYVEALRRVSDVPDEAFASGLRGVGIALGSAMVEPLADRVVVRTERDVSCSFHRGFVETIEVNVREWPYVLAAIELSPIRSFMVVSRDLDELTVRLPNDTDVYLEIPLAGQLESFGSSFAADRAEQRQKIIRTVYELFQTLYLHLTLKSPIATDLRMIRRYREDLQDL